MYLVMKFDMATLKKLLLASVLVGFASSASAGEVNPCDVWSWQITGAIQSQNYTGTVPSLPAPISATSCAGVYQGNEGPTLNPSPNLGYNGDGLLNGQSGLLSPTQFIAPSQLQDLKGDGAPLDPGWIMLGFLGDVDGNTGALGNEGELNYSSVTTGLGTFNLGNYVTYKQFMDYMTGGTWRLEVDADIVAKLALIGLDRSVFDHLAFSVKSSDYWAVYDFDFNKINQANSGAFDLNQPYVLSGTWTTNKDFYNCQPQTGKGDVACVPKNGQDISHMSVWVRDPIGDNKVPAPGTLFLLGIGLVALSFFVKRT